MPSRFCTGESGLVRPFTEEEFKEPCDPKLTCALFCDYWGIKMPVLKQTYSVRKDSFHGWYKDGVLTYSDAWLGLILHELAHHVVKEKGLKQPHVHHDSHFWTHLQKMIDMSR